MHPHENQEYTTKLMAQILIDYRRSSLKKNNDTLDKSYDQIVSSTGWKRNFALVGGWIGVFCIDHFVHKAPAAEGLSLRRLKLFSIAGITIVVSRLYLDLMVASKDISGQMALKYEPQLLSLHPNLQKYYQELGVEIPTGDYSETQKVEIENPNVGMKSLEDSQPSDQQKELYGDSTHTDLSIQESQNTIELETLGQDITKWNQNYQYFLPAYFLLYYKREKLQKDNDLIDQNYDEFNKLGKMKEFSLTLLSIFGFQLYERLVLKPLPNEGVSRRRVILYSKTILTIFGINAFSFFLQTRNSNTFQMASKYESQLLAQEPFLVSQKNI